MAGSDMKERMTALVAARRYDESAMPEFLACLESQIADGWYDISM